MGNFRVIDRQRMFAVRLYGKGDIRIDKVLKPISTLREQARIKVKAVGICGSDLNAYDRSDWKNPFILGHEFSGIVDEVGDDCYDGFNQLLREGTKVAVDPNQPCGKCEPCEKGHPNLCTAVHFTGFYPDNGALQELISVPARCCFPVPDTIEFESAALLETLGVALHAIDLISLKAGYSATILGAGPIGLCILQILRSMNIAPIFIVDQFDWRLKIGKELGGLPLNFTRVDPAEFILQSTGNRGTDVVFEAAWAGEAARQAAEIVIAGGKLVMIGIPKDDKLVFEHSTLRRKGLTVIMVRRMKHTYPRSIQLLERGTVDLIKLISHRFPLKKTAEAFTLNAGYKDQVLKVIIEM